MEAKSLTIDCAILFQQRTFKLRVKDLESISELKCEIRQLLNPPQDSRINVYFSDKVLTIHRIRKFPELMELVTEKEEPIKLHVKII